MVARGSIVEHPFGPLKHALGMRHFMMRGLAQGPAEFD